MKKLVVFAAIAFLSLSAVFAQVLPKSGVKNTLSTAFGLPYGESGDSNRDDVRLYGFFDTLQARVDISQFTMEGMLNWNIINNVQMDLHRTIIQTATIMELAGGQIQQQIIIT